MTDLVSIRTDVTFQRLVYERRDDPTDRAYTAWAANPHFLAGWMSSQGAWPDFRLVYIERCRLKPRPGATS